MHPSPCRRLSTVRRNPRPGRARAVPPGLAAAPLRLAAALGLATLATLATGCQALLGIEDVTGMRTVPGDAGPDGAGPPGPPAEAFKYRRQIIIDAGGQGMPAGYSVRFVHDVRARLQENKVRLDGHDWRIYRQVGDQMVEVPRWMDDGDGPFGTNPQASTWFRVSEALVPNEHFTAYWVYYGYPELDTPPPWTLDEVFVFGDDFEGDLSKWTLNQRGESALVQSQTIWAGGQSLRIEPGNQQLCGGIHRDMVLPHETLMVSHHLQQAQTGASFGNMHAADTPWAGRDLDDWTPLQGRVWGEIGAGNVMFLFTDTAGTSTPWSPAIDANIWRRIEIVHDPVANQVKARFDGGAFAGPYGDMNRSGQPIASVAIEGQAEGGVFFVDNYIIRRYVDPEPVVNVGDEEAL